MEGYFPHITEEETKAHAEGKRGTFKEAKRTPSRDITCSGSRGHFHVKEKVLPCALPHPNRRADWPGCPGQEDAM